MQTRPRKRSQTTVLAIVVLVSSLLTLLPGLLPLSRSDFASQHGGKFMLHGSPYSFIGINNYYLIYKSDFMVDDLLATAKNNGFEVVRLGGFLDIGRPDGTQSVDEPNEGTYFQFWDGLSPAYNDGPTGLRKLDYVVYRAGQLGLKLTIILTNNWVHFGGMDQYVLWRGGNYHDDFYRDPVIRRWYQAYVAHIVNRVNSYTGVTYKHDPTIFSWDLANEPRCYGSTAYPTSSQCTTKTVVSWAAEMSTYLKTIDRNHLVGVGDEGFFCLPDGRDWAEDCSIGVDTVALSGLGSVDYMSLHLYAGQDGRSAAWGREWIIRHLRAAEPLGKPVLLGEFGYKGEEPRAAVYRAWTEALLSKEGNGALLWMLAGKTDEGQPYPDFDGYSVYCPGAVCSALRTLRQDLLPR